MIMSALKPRLAMGGFMRTQARLALAGLAATLLMAFALGSASAGRLSFSSQTFRITWSSFEFFGEGGVEATVRCPLTLEGSFHSRTTSKVFGLLIGYVNRATVSPRERCTGGAATILTATLPWHVNYDSFSGTLPNLTSVGFRIRKTAILVEVGLGTTCLYQEGGEGGTTAGAIAFREASGRINAFRLDELARLVRVSGTFGCPTSLGFRGTGSLSAGGTTTSVTVTLI
jgi:hypothetical protein